MPVGDPRRQLTVPPNQTYKSTSPSPQSAPPTLTTHVTSINEHQTSSSSLQSKFIPPTRKKSIPLASRSVHPLQMEIDRLTAVCEEHERVIRSSLSTIKHYVITNMPDIFDRVNKLDDDAEAITATVQQTLSAHIPPFQSHLRKIISDRSSDVDLMKKRTTPWKDVVSDMGLSPSHIRENGDTKDHVGIGKLKRVNRSEGDGDALTRMEMWADEVEMYLSSEIVRAKEQLVSKTGKRKFLLRSIFFLIYLITALILGLLVFLLAKRGYDHFKHIRRLQKLGI
ncbi:uncharacterized protein IL334_003607 [Kwoniella shivajii]|uniref:t-SNARE coiled-coil homology domain-containing protein n=1 Tax=Kwoniella shivajii TaxID=564305 RepID=A0ABZ1CY17_9TREE|nr:hypothetical protein IL334_003607 [Kwoniella shivajii]